MNYDTALHKMKEGFDVQVPGWSGYWTWDAMQSRVLVMNEADKVVRSMTVNESYTDSSALLRTDWKVNHPPETEKTEKLPKWWEEVDFAPEEPHVLKIGDEGPDVAKLQAALRANGVNIGTPDGVFGSGTQRAVRAYQRAVGLVADGIFGDKTAASMYGRAFPEALTQAAMDEAAELLSCQVEAIMAVSTVESRGRGFFLSARPKILFERHVMRRRMLHNNLDPTPYLRTQPNLVNSRTGGYKGGEAEYGRLNEAAKIDHVSAHESASWGAYQIMGYHWEHLGYDSIDQYVALMRQNEDEHLRAFTRFIKADRRLLRAIQGSNPDFTRFASIYNGPAYDRHNPPYDVRMAREFDRLVKLGRES